jgi:hypothetical protein
MRRRKLARLGELYREAEEIRGSLRISAPLSVIYLSNLDLLNAKQVIAEADGLGAAVVRVIEGNYPLDFFIHEEKEFSSEDGAVKFAERLIEHRPRIAEAFQKP